MSFSVSRCRSRVQDLLAYFTKEYIKAYKIALIAAIRDKKRAGAEQAAASAAAASLEGGEPEQADEDSVDSRPHFLLLLDPDHMPQPAVRIEGEVYVGDGFKKKQKWVMSRNYMVTTTDSKDSKPADPASPSSAGAVAPGPPADDEAASSGQRRDSSVPDTADARIWLDDDSTDCCMNPACGAKFSLFNRRRHCRLCGEIFCKKCRAFCLDKDNKFCEPCHSLRTNPDAAEAKLPLLTRPEVRSRQLSFYRYKVALTDADLFAAAGAGDAASKQADKDGHNGKHVLILTHRRSTRPQLKIGFDSEEVRDQWRSLLGTATWAAPSPLVNDPVLRQSFLMAYRKLRWHAWVWAGWELDGTESEMLADILSEVIEREMLPSSVDGMARKLAVKSLYRVVVSAVSAAWTSLMQQLPPVRKVVEEAAEKLLGPIFEEEKKIQEKTKAPMEEAAAKGLEAAEGKLQELFADKCPVIAAAAEAQLNCITKNVAQFLSEHASKGERSARDWEWDWSWVKWRASWGWSYQQGDIARMIYAKLIQEGSDASRRLGWDLISDLRDLHLCAIREIRHVMNTSGAAGASTGAELNAALRAAYPDVIARAAKDLPVLFQWRMTQALHATLLPPLLENTGKVIDALCSPLLSVLPESLQDVIDPQRTCSEILESVVTKQEKILVQTILEPLKGDTIKRGDTLAATPL